MKKWLIALCCVLIAAAVAFVTVLNNKNTSIDTLNKDLSDIQAEYNTLKDKNEKNEKTIQELNQQVDELTAEKDGLNAENGRLNETLEGLNRNLSGEAAGFIDKINHFGGFVFNLYTLNFFVFVEAQVVVVGADVLNGHKERLLFAGS